MATSKNINIETNRLTWFLMGTVMTLAIIFTALEYKSSYNDDDIDESLLEDFSADIEPYPIVEKTPIAAAPIVKEDKVSADKLKITETESKTDEKSSINGSEFGVDTETDNGSGIEGLETQQKPLIEEAKAVPKPVDFRVVQQIPEFPGGMGAFIQWLTANLRYPTIAQNRKIEGKVVVTFIVNEDGSTTDLKLAKSVNSLLDKEAMRVMRTMPKWKPGVENNKPCRTMMAIPIIFKL